VTYQVESFVVVAGEYAEDLNCNVGNLFTVRLYHFKTSKSSFNKLVSLIIAKREGLTTYKLIRLMNDCVCSCSLM